MDLSVPARPTAQDPPSAPQGRQSLPQQCPSRGQPPAPHAPHGAGPSCGPTSQHGLRLPLTRGVPDAQGQGCPTAPHHSCPAPGQGWDGSPWPPQGPDAASPTHFVYHPHSCTQLICLQVVMSWRGCGRLRRAPQVSPRNTTLEKGAPHLVSSGTENKCK